MLSNGRPHFEVHSEMSSKVLQGLAHISEVPPLLPFLSLPHLLPSILLSRIGMTESACAIILSSQAHGRCH